MEQMVNFRFGRIRSDTCESDLRAHHLQMHRRESVTNEFRNV